MKPFSCTIIIALIVSCIVIAQEGCKKSTSGPNYTRKMGTIRNWHIYYHETQTNSHQPYLDTSYFLPDQSFAVTVIDGTTISLGGNQDLKFLQADTTNDLYFFCIPGDPTGSGVAYYYRKDSIVITSFFES